MHKQKSTRRRFLEVGLGAGIVLAGGVLLLGGEDDKVILISKEGKLYEVNPKNLDNATRKLLRSNNELQQWLENKDHG